MADRRHPRHWCLKKMAAAARSQAQRALLSANTCERAPTYERQDLQHARSHMPHQDLQHARSHMPQAKARRAAMPATCNASVDSTLSLARLICRQ